MRSTKGEGESMGGLAASITPRSNVDTALILIALFVESFDGSGRVKRRKAAFIAIMWQLPDRTVGKARSDNAGNLTVNDNHVASWLR